MTRVVLDNVTLGYQRHPAVHHLSGVIEGGELLAIVGPNGAGKSTLLRALAGDLAPLSGHIRSEPAHLRIAWMPQLVEFDTGFPARAADLVACGLWRGGWPGLLTRADNDCIAGALEQVGLAGLSERPLTTLSGGQLQRVRLARLLVQEADLILLDEPFAALDDMVTPVIEAALRRWVDEGRAVVAVIHERPLVERLADKVLLLAREAVAWGLPDAVVTPENMARAGQLPQAWDDFAAVCQRAGTA